MSSEPSLLLQWMEALGPALVAGIGAYTAVKVEMAVIKTRLGSVENQMVDLGRILRTMADYKTRFEMQGARLDEVTRQVNELSRRFIDFIVERNQHGKQRPDTRS